jgi:hypothetical protein
MSSSDFDDDLRAHGFHNIGQLNYRVKLGAWWNPAPDHRLQVLVLRLGNACLVKGSKSYYLKAVTPDGATWIRDLPALHGYLESHFAEIRLAFSHFRDVPLGFAQSHALKHARLNTPSRTVPSAEQIAHLQQQIEGKKRDIQSLNDLVAMSEHSDDLLSAYVRRDVRSAQTGIAAMQADVQVQQQQLSVFQNLQREYAARGAAASYCFSINSHLHVAQDPGQFQDILHAVVKELRDQHRYEITQKLQGGRLQIQVAEAEEPVLAWIEEWFAGALSPNQLDRLSPAFRPLQMGAQNRTMIVPKQAIIINGHVHDQEKHVAARVVSTFIRHLDKTEGNQPDDVLDPERTSAAIMPLNIGNRIDLKHRPIGPAIVPLAEFGHTFVSGTSGSGKSFFSRVVVEEASFHSGLDVLVIDPGSQFSGLLAPENRESILHRYSEFGMKREQARGFSFSYFAPAISNVPNPPHDHRVLASGRSIVSLKGMGDAERCALAASILESVFECASAGESERPRLLILVDEVQLLLRKRVDDSARVAAARAERALDKIARLGRKYGIQLFLVSQTISDFGHDLASFRQLMHTRAFFRNSDNEVQYASSILSDGRPLLNLPTGTMILYNPRWGQNLIRVRPPLSKVQELPEQEFRSVIPTDRSSAIEVSADARQLLAIIRDQVNQHGQPAHLTKLAELSGMTSKRKLHAALDELEQFGVIRTTKLPIRGRPRVVSLP